MIALGLEGRGTGSDVLSSGFCFDPFIPTAEESSRGHNRTMKTAIDQMLQTFRPDQAVRPSTPIKI
jgi:hypothetical protein